MFINPHKPKIDINDYDAQALLDIFHIPFEVGKHHLCPWHGDTANPALSISDEGLYFCWVCEESGNILTLIVKYTGYTMRKIFKIIERAPMSVSSIKSKKVDLEILNERVKKFHYNLIYEPKYERCLTYLLNRGINRKTIFSFKLGAVYSSIIIPYFFNGNVFNYRIRFLPNQKLKYATCKSAPTTKLFFNHDAIDKYATLYIVEGELNALSLVEMGHNNVISFGSALSWRNKNLNLLKNKELIVYFDNDKIGNKERKAFKNKMKEMDIEIINEIKLEEETDINDLLKRGDFI